MKNNLFKYALVSFLALPASFALTGCSNSGLELLKFNRAEAGEASPKSEKLRLNEVGDDVAKIDGPQDVLMKATVRNTNRMSFIDLVLYSSELKTQVVYNEGNGEYQCSSTTVFEDNQWVTNILLTAPLKETIGELSVKEITFLSASNSKASATINPANSTFKYHVHDFDAEVITPKGDYSKGRGKGECKYCGYIGEFDIPSYEDECRNDFTYLLSEDKQSYQPYTYDGLNKHNRVVIPRSYEGLPVTLHYSPFSFDSDPVKQSATTFDELVVPDTVKILRDSIFMSCPAKTIYLPKSIETFENNEFVNMTAFGIEDNLTNIIIDPENPLYASKNGVVYNKGLNKICYYPVGRRDNAVIDSGTTEIGEFCFAWSQIKTLYIPVSVTKIGKCSLNTSVDCSLEYIDYGGTKSQWNAIEGHENASFCFERRPGFVIHCTNGDIG